MTTPPTNDLDLDGARRHANYVAFLPPRTPGAVRRFVLTFSEFGKVTL